MVTIQVTDNGTPPLSDTATFNVYVVLPPRLEIRASANATQVTLSLPTIAGKRYQVLFKDSLGEAQWQPLGDPQMATGTTATITDSIGTRAYRFYLIAILD
jgi:hypothetical protein